MNKKTGKEISQYYLNKAKRSTPIHEIFHLDGSLQDRIYKIDHTQLLISYSTSFINSKELFVDFIAIGYLQDQKESLSPSSLRFELNNNKTFVPHSENHASLIYINGYTRYFFIKAEALTERSFNNIIYKQDLKKKIESL